MEDHTDPHPHPDETVGTIGVTNGGTTCELKGDRSSTTAAVDSCKDGTSASTNDDIDDNIDDDGVTGNSAVGFAAVLRAVRWVAIVIIFYL